MDAPDWNKTFEVAVITRGDLTEVGLSPQQIDRLTDADMQTIARKMADYYANDEYWQHLEEAYRFVMEETLGQSGLEQNV